jgi:hypothetical protein
MPNPDDFALTFPLFPLQFRFQTGFPWDPPVSKVNGVPGLIGTRLK